MTLLNIINHRAINPWGEGTDGILFTKQGDYVQQFGVLGSDFPALSTSARDQNKELDPILGEGRNRKDWLRNYGEGMRVGPFGHTLLVDLKDDATVIPNCLKTLFGHGTYTRYEQMLRLCRLVADHSYP